MAPLPEDEDKEVSNFKFKDGEKVLCFHGPLLYEAKCLKAQVKDKINRYYIHYSGWNKNWDEWVPESRVLKYNDTNLQKRKDLEAINSKESKKKPMKGGAKKDPKDRESTVLPPQEKTPKQKHKEAEASAASASNETTAGEPTKKRVKREPRAEQNVETEEEYLQKLEIKVKILDELKHRIVDDWNLINYQGKLPSLPARIPVDTVISDYIKQRTTNKGMTPNKESAMLEVLDGIKEYFNTMLGPQLLYDLERPQYNKLIAEHPDSTASQLYGVTHLLRLLTALGGILAYTPLNEDSIILSTNTLTDLQKFIAKSASTYFSNNDYIDAPEEKKSKAKAEN